ncbi:GNAT family N-acetyltransferase [Marinivivus vitaminiproducens]|uniref:GNAT family N-acetyltransferase n=1 Tax=Marinivivus vitaminiproducens TaxID=3035935 RepID=UPI0027AA57F2|nr:GNAT family N-acetyltransferase [Geminicoccaceae bacterium SCSIO 64248]
MTIAIRPARPADVAALAQLSRQLNRHQGDPETYFTGHAIARDLFGRNAVAEAFLATSGREPVGYAVFIDAYETAYAAHGLFMCDLFVVEEARGRGVGKALVTAVARTAKERGLTFVWWTSKTWNTGAHAFYRRLGAEDQTVVAHALHGDAFDRLAGEDEPG